jgi:hypothetical protein
MAASWPSTDFTSGRRAAELELRDENSIASKKYRRSLPGSLNREQSSTVRLTSLSRFYRLLVARGIAMVLT